MSITTPGSQALIVRLLSEEGKLDEATLEAVQKIVSRDPACVEEALIQEGVVDEKVIAAAYAAHLGGSWLDLADGASGPSIEERSEGREPEEFGLLQDVATGVGDVAGEISEETCRQLRAAPAVIRDGVLHLACLNPSDYGAEEELRMLSGHSVVLHASTLTLYTTLLQELFGGGLTPNAEGTPAEAAGGDGSVDRSVDLDLSRELPQSREAQVLRIVNNTILRAVEEGASDIHIEAYEDCVRIRFRVDGNLIEIPAPPASCYSQIISRLKILAKMDIAERRTPQDGAISASTGDQRVDLRVSTVPTVFGEKMVLRLLEKDSIPPGLEHLGFGEDQTKAFMDAAHAPHGLIFVTGPTGSGKSTTLYCCLKQINDSKKNIVTVEDPVEYRFTGLNQVHVRSGIGMTFASALRAFLRQDPDVIMVGEVRDQETAQICIRAALTGHLVLSTLHTNSALQVIHRLLDMGIEPFLLGPALRLVEAQRLVRRLCPECKRGSELPADVAERHGLEAGIEIFRPGADKCSRCRSIGYKGRVGIYEVIKGTPGLQELIVQQASEAEMREEVLKDGTELLEHSARHAVVAGMTSLEEVSDFIRVEPDE